MFLLDKTQKIASHQCGVNEDRTVRSMLQSGEAALGGQGIPYAIRESEQMLCAALSLDLLHLYLNMKTAVSTKDRDRFFNWIERRSRREPMQYILGAVDFYGRGFIVSPGVFIPRPETELIVEEAKTLVPRPQSILDLCTGSGVLAITLAKEFEAAAITAIDCSDTALDTARLNQKRHRTPQVRFHQGDLFQPLRSGRDRFDLIVCNPPYIAEEDRDKMDREVLAYEPHRALFSPDGGQAHIKQILIQAPDFLSPDGTLILEIGLGQSAPLRDFVKTKTSFTARFIKDFSGIDRILVCQWTK